MMKHLTQKVALLLVFYLLLATQNTQAAGVGVTLISYTFDTVGLGYTITVNAKVTNYDSVAFTGSLDFGLRNHQQTLSNTGIFNKPPYSSQQITLYPNETVPAIFSIDIDPQYFAPGPDVVVVWPICNQPITDSIVIDIYIETPSSVVAEKNDLFNWILIDDYVFLKNLPSDINVQQVRLFNLLGQQIYNYRSQHISEVHLPIIPKGIYLCEFITTDNRRQVIRFFR